VPSARIAPTAACYSATSGSLALISWRIGPRRRVAKGSRISAPRVACRRYAILACGAVAAFPPGDAITLLLESVPLYLLFEASLLLASIAERRAARGARETPFQHPF